MSSRKVDLVGCARCLGDGHPGLEFQQFDQPVPGPRGTTYEWWALCPETGEPIMMAVYPIDESATGSCSCH